MNFLKKVLSSSEKASGRTYPGVEFLEVALIDACNLLGKESIDNLYRASLLGGGIGGRLMLAHDERCFQKWGKGDATKAARLIQVWASTSVLRMLQKQENQDDIIYDTVKRFSRLFNTDEGELEAELLAYNEASKSEMLRRRESGRRIFSPEILYLRTLRALGDKGVPSLKLLPLPWGTVREMLETNPKLAEILDIKILTNVRPTWFLIPKVLIETLDTTLDYFNKMEAEDRR